jgi:hypothetical protein
MRRFRDLEGRFVFGTLVFADGSRPFLFDLDSGELAYDDHVTGAPSRTLGWLEKRRLTRQLRKAVGPEAMAVRIGEYLCRECNRWVAADGSHWSAGICLSCSMDRDSDRFG